MSERNKLGILSEITDFLSGILSNKGAVIAISGGIDSATVLMLVARVLKENQIIALFMPDDRTSEIDIRDVRHLAKASGVEIKTVNIQPLVDAFRKSLSAEDPKAIGNIKSRIRMVTAYYYANINGGLVIGTTNRSEYLTGYFTKYGDGGCDVEPIINLYKHEVRELARALNVPNSIIDKKPSAGLWENQLDEVELGMTYEELDRILQDLFDDDTGEISESHSKIMRMFQNSEHKRRMPLGKDN